MSQNATAPKVNLYTVRDSKAEVFYPPHQSQTHGTAIRQFQTLASDPTHLFCQHAEDFGLYFIGTFDQATGITDNLPQPQHLASAVEFVNGNIDIGPQD